MRIPIKTAILALVAAIALSACHKAETFENDAYGNFDALWKIIDEHYCFFEEKDIDWKATGEKYRARIKPDMTYIDFFNLCSEMLAELKDGHVNLSSSFNTSYYRKWWSDYPQDFNLRTLQQYYLDFDYGVAGGIYYKTLRGNIGYMYCGSFANRIGEGNLDNILASFDKCRCLIIDVRNNGGGLLTNVPALVGRFIDKKIRAGYIRHKKGPGHNDFSDPYPIEYSPAAKGRVKWSKPVIVLTNRSTFSAANDFVSVMKMLPDVRIVGARTGGGGGLPFTSEIPIGWTVRFSASPISNSQDISTESGIDPSSGCEKHSSDIDLAVGCDNILEFALNLAVSGF